MTTMTLRKPLLITGTLLALTLVASMVVAPVLVGESTLRWHAYYQ